MKTLFERVFSGNDEMYALAVKAVDEALAKLARTLPPPSATPLTACPASMP